jgi:hypothetical protein
MTMTKTASERAPTSAADARGSPPKAWKSANRFSLRSHPQPGTHVSQANYTDIFHLIFPVAPITFGRGAQNRPAGLRDVLVSYFPKNRKMNITNLIAMRPAFQIRAIKTSICEFDASKRWRCGRTHR